LADGQLLPKTLTDVINVDVHLGDNCIVIENFTASIGDLMAAN
jgi:hypothetical protein